MNSIIFRVHTRLQWVVKARSKICTLLAVPSPRSSLSRFLLCVFFSFTILFVFIRSFGMAISTSEATSTNCILSRKYFRLEIVSVPLLFMGLIVLRWQQQKLSFWFLVIRNLTANDRSSLQPPKRCPFYSEDAAKVVEIKKSNIPEKGVKVPGDKKNKTKSFFQLPQSPQMQYYVQQKITTNIHFSLSPISNNSKFHFDRFKDTCTE